MRKIGKSEDEREMHYSAGVMVSCNEKYIMMNRKNPPPGFACPAGHIDEGEDPKNAAIREVYEETGIKLDDAEFILEEEIPWNYCKNASVHFWYLYRASAASENFIFNKEEEKSLAWYTVEEIKDLNLEPVWKYWFEKLKII